MQVRLADQARYHNLKPPSSLGSGWNEIHSPPAEYQVKFEQKPKRFDPGTGFTSVETCHTHTHCARASPPNATRRPSVLMMVCAVRLGTCNMRSRKERPSPHFLVSGSFAHDHTPQAHTHIHTQQKHTHAHTQTDLPDTHTRKLHTRTHLT